VVFTDYGLEFYVNKWGVKGCVEHGFELYLKGRGVLYILCGVNYFQTSGKVEKWYDLYIHYRVCFFSLGDMFLWCNVEKSYGVFNLGIAETSSQAFVRKMRSEVWIELAAKTFN